MALENVREKKVFIKLDKVREIRFTFAALAELEEIYMNFTLAYREFYKGSIVALGSLLHVGLRHKEDLSLQQTAELLKLTTGEELIIKIHEAIRADFPDIKDIEIIDEEEGFLPGDAPPIEEETEEFIDWERVSYFACYVLFIPEEKFWNMTPRRFHSINKERKKFWRNNNGRN